MGFRANATIFAKIDGWSSLSLEISFRKSLRRGRCRTFLYIGFILHKANSGIIITTLRLENRVRSARHALVRTFRKQGSLGQLSQFRQVALVLLLAFHIYYIDRATYGSVIALRLAWGVTCRFSRSGSGPS
jgi:hypothetical protein